MTSSAAIAEAMIDELPAWCKSASASSNLQATRDLYNRCLTEMESASREEWPRLVKALADSLTDDDLNVAKRCNDPMANEYGEYKRATQTKGMTSALAFFNALSKDEQINLQKQCVIATVLCQVPFHPYLISICRSHTHTHTQMHNKRLGRALRLSSVWGMNPLVFVAVYRLYFGSAIDSVCKAMDAPRFSHVLETDDDALCHHQVQCPLLFCKTLNSARRSRWCGTLHCNTRTSWGHSSSRARMS